MAVPDLNAQHLARALADVLNEALAQGQAVDVPGLGTFRRRHRPGHIAERDGRMVMLPPVDAIEFQPLSR
ncbi:MAG: HU family DNA-binding protein [Rhodothermales bacterium]|nr:HU family DNA-binding protein [Rhodothermales bacterium]MCA0269997.1 HU family DNA-binding protein [Bacteroidota bacterium]